MSYDPVKAWLPSRVDQGVDGTLSPEYGYRASDECVVVEAVTTPNWGGGYIVVKMLKGLLPGQYIYIAEGIQPKQKVGTIVQAGHQIGVRVVNQFNGVTGNVEIGFADPKNPNRPLAQSLPGWNPAGGDQDVAAITAGMAMNTYIQLLGGAPGINESGNLPDYSLLPEQIQKALNL